MWEQLRAGGRISDIIEGIPDEFYQWAVEEETRQLEAFNESMEHARLVVAGVDTGLPRKDIARFFKEHRNPSVLFQLLDGKDPTDLIWRNLRPKHEVPTLPVSV